MSSLKYAASAVIYVTGSALAGEYHEPATLVHMQDELNRVLGELARDCTQEWLQRHRVITDNEMSFVYCVKTPTGVDGDLAIMWELEVDDYGGHSPYVTAIVPGYRGF